MDLMPVNSGNSQDEDSESDSSADSSSLSNYDSAVFQSSLRSFQMSESKRKRLRELEASENLFSKSNSSLYELDLLKIVFTFRSSCLKKKKK